MSWQPEIDDLERRWELARRMGGPEGIERQHSQGKLTVRERIDRLADAGSFREFMGLAGRAVYEDGRLSGFTPKPLVEGFCQIDGRKVVVTGGDFTVRGGSGGAGGGLGSETPSNRRALEWKLPYVRLLHAAGGSVRSFEEIGRTYLPDGNVWSAVDVQLMRTVPVVSAVMGSVAGLPAVNACLAYWNLMVKGTSALFPGGPPVVKAALGYEVTKEELGGEEMHVRQSGVIDNLAADEGDAFIQIRRFLGYLLSNVWEMAPRQETDDDPARRDDALLSVIPRDRKRPYDAHRIVELVADRESFFEIAPFLWPGADHRPRPVQRLSGRRHGEQPDVRWWFDRRCGGRESPAFASAMRHVPSAARLDSRRAGIHGGPGLGTSRDREGGRAAGDGDMRLADAVDHGRHRPAVRRGRAVPAPAERNVPGLRVAFRQLGSMHIEGGEMAAYRREVESAPDPARSWRSWRHA